MRLCVDSHFYNNISLLFMEEDGSWLLNSICEWTRCCRKRRDGGIIRGIKDLSIDVLQSWAPGVYLRQKIMHTFVKHLFNLKERFIGIAPAFKRFLFIEWMQRRNSFQTSIDDAFLLLLFTIVPHIIAIVTKVKISFFKIERITRERKNKIK